ncbi:signal peptidase I [Halorarius halobius]|uniref:signal peptidase I n=1 Tax=Halorarius halobius TaxID=2962671 RepID=UPI0020CEC2F4|nr:signal peptidase I [Halorarius halobius]
MRPSTRRLAHAVGALLLVACVTPFVVTAVPQTVGASHSYTVMSGSMEPAISPGDVVLVREVPPRRIERGDVITYEFTDGGGAVQRRTHRVVDVVAREDGRYFRTKGDANDAPDPQLVPADAVVGRVVATLPVVGHVTLFASTRVGFVALVLVPVGLLFLSELWSLVGALRDARTADGPAEDAESSAPPDADSTPEGDR